MFYVYPDCGDGAACAAKLHVAACGAPRRPAGLQRGVPGLRQALLRHRVQQGPLQQRELRAPAGGAGPHVGQLRDQHPRVRHGRQHGERAVRLRRRLGLGHLLREHHRGAVRPAGAGGVGPGAQAALHVARPIREVRHLPPVPRRHAGRGARRLRRRQRGLLDADPENSFNFVL
ncbi:Protein of unknown function, partial [Gryllus bimaculatus]